MAELAYELQEGTAAQVAQVRRWPWQQDGEDWLLSGSCPRCGHGISKRLVSTAYLVQPEPTETPALRRPVPPRGTLTVFCNCGVTHAQDKSGCGFFATGVPGPGGV